MDAESGKPTARRTFDSMPADIGSGKKTKPNTHKTIDVYCRFRPTGCEDKPSAYYLLDESGECVELEAPDEVLRKNQGIKRYVFTKVFDAQCTQEQVYEITMRDMVASLLQQERNGLVFSYGVTNAGKTHTIIGTRDNQGVLPRLLSDLMRYKEAARHGQLPDEHFVEHDRMTGSSLSLKDMEVAFECFEIYNEEIFDLQVDVKRNAERPKLKIRDINKKMVIEDLTKSYLKSTEQAEEIVNRCLKNRQVANTQLNSNSSRSHTVFRLTVSLTFEGIDKTKDIARLVGYICIVDLAGSERAKRTENADGRLKEACGINGSLLVLGRCLQALKKDLVVPFRDCKLTKFLSEFFVYDSSIKMITNINPRDDDFQESLRVLNYSSLAREVKLIVSEFRAARLESAHKPQRSVARQTMPNDLGFVEAEQAHRFDQQQTHHLASIADIEISGFMKEVLIKIDALGAVAQSIGQRIKRIEERCRLTSGARPRQKMPSHQPHPGHREHRPSIVDAIPQVRSPYAHTS